MAQTKRKRRSKHRGNAAGAVVSRGRTGRKAPEDPKAKSRASANQRRLDRFDKEPSWRSAALRGGGAAGVFFILVLVMFKQKPGPAIGLAGFMTLLYVPLGYYTDLYLYRRRQRKKAAGK